MSSGLSFIIVAKIWSFSTGSPHPIRAASALVSELPCIKRSRQRHCPSKRASPFQLTDHSLTAATDGHTSLPTAERMVAHIS